MSGELVVIVVDPDAASLQTAVDLIRPRYPQVEGVSELSLVPQRVVVGKPTCVIADFSARAPGGASPVRWLKQNVVDVPVIATLANAAVAAVIGAFREGAADFVQKPFDREELIGAVDRLAPEAERSARIAPLKYQVTERLARLSLGEREVLHLLLQGRSNREMAAELKISIRTVEDRRARLMRKMAADSLAELVEMVVLSGYSWDSPVPQRRARRAQQ